MLEEQLNAARQARRQRTIKIAVTAGAIILLSALALVISTSCCGFGNKDAEVVEQTLEKSSRLASPSLSESKPVDTAARESYLQLLNRYQHEIEPALASIDLARWQPDNMQQLEKLKDTALTAFTNADYATAAGNMRSAASLAETLIESGAEQFEQAMAAAAQAYEQDNYDEAKPQVDQALMLNTDSAEAQILAGKIDALGSILPLLNQARVARTENNAEKELAVIKQILEIAPEREAEQARQQELLGAISLKKFQSHLNRAYTAIEQQDATTARKHINSAQQIYPNRAEIRDVNAALQALEKQQRVAGYASQALSAMREDNWQEAKQQLSLALAERPNDKTLLDLLSKTDSILSITQQIEQQLANPYRLSNNTVKQQANSLLEDAMTYSQASPLLAGKADELANLIEKMNRKVSVKVLSDNKTNVLVRGVGVVGVTDAKVIELPPGEYKFEGKRPGYRSKLIEVLIPYDKSTMQLTVICDEPI